jgi:beta-lactamase superfamily II metal-dependent hydrolase
MPLALFTLLMWAGVADPLPPWTPGTLDIHQIATGRGNSALVIFPDGTTLLVDAGAAGDGIPETDPHPNASRRPGEWIARYLQRHLPAGAKELDYALITHFHVDHDGGIADVDRAVPIKLLIDRGWPDYSYPGPVNDAPYRKFIEARKRVEKFKVGSSTQIRALHEPRRDFEVRNIIANGEVWTGTGETTKNLFPPVKSLSAADLPNENMCSLGIRLRYGKFSYFTSGDLPGTPDPGFPAWHGMEAAIAPVVGAVDVHVVNQHGSMAEESDEYLSALRSTVLIVPSWAPSHPAPDVLKRIMNSRYPPATRYVFATEMREAAKIVIGQRATRLAGPAGHVVARVEPGGERYTVYVLDNRDERDLILSATGPLASGR